MNVNRSLVHDDLFSPDLDEKFLAGKDAPRLHRQCREETEFLRTKVEVDGIGPGDPAIRFDLDRTAVENGRRTNGRNCPPANSGAHPRQEFPKRERLHNIVIGAEFETVDFVLLFTTCGEDQNRHVRKGPDRAQDFVSVHSRKHQIEQNQVERLGLTFGQRQPALAISGAKDPIALAAQVVGKRAQQCRIVFDDQNCCFITLCGPLRHLPNCPHIV